MGFPATAIRKAASTGIPFQVLTGCVAGALLCAPSVAGERERLDSVRLPTVSLSSLRMVGADGVPAAEGFHPATLGFDRVGRPTRAFYDTHLMPELAHQMGGFRTLHGVPVAASEIEDSMIFSAAGDQARRSSIKGATNALKEFVMEATSLNRMIESIYRPKRQAPEAGGPAPGRLLSKRSDLGFSFGIAHRMPNVGFKYRLGSTVTRFELSGYGSIDLQVEKIDARRMRAAIGLRYDHHEGWYGLNYQVRF